MTKYYIFKKYFSATEFVCKGELNSVHDCEMFWFDFQDGFREGIMESIKHLMTPRGYDKPRACNMTEGTRKLSFVIHSYCIHAEYFMTFDSEEAKVLIDEAYEKMSRRHCRR